MRYAPEGLLEKGDILSQPWVQELMARNDTSSVLTAGAMLADDSELPADHMFTAFLKVGLVRDMLCLYSSTGLEFHTIVKLGTNVCGHPGVVHGGLTSAIIDETLGALNYVLKREGVIGSGPSFTVHLEVDYKKPVPSDSIVICTAYLQGTEDRKTFVNAEVKDCLGGELYALGKGIFVIPRKQNPLTQNNKLQESGIFSAPVVKNVHNGHGTTISKSLKT